jgi:hypothetical protein
MMAGMEINECPGEGNPMAVVILNIAEIKSNFKYRDSTSNKVDLHFLSRVDDFDYLVVSLA